MSILTIPPTSPSIPVPQVRPTTRRWTCEEFHRMGDLGWFEGEKLILVDGEILKMPPPDAPHDVAVALCDQMLRTIFAAGFWVRGQMSLVIGRNGDPLPDIVVVSGSPRDYAQQKPTSALLVVEVSDSSLDYDRGDKASLYAAAGIADYWIIDLVNRRLEVRRRPVTDVTQKYGFGYADMATLEPAASVTPLAAPQAAILVADLLP